MLYSYIPDDILVEEVLSGNVKAFEGLVLKYEKIVAGIISRRIPKEDWQDIAQNVFINAFNALGNLEHTESFGPWLKKIALRECLKYRRQKGRSKESVFSELEESGFEFLDKVLSPKVDDPETIILNEQNKTALTKVMEWSLGQLSSLDRMVLELVYFEEYSQKEAADLLNISLGNVKIRLFRAKRKLRKIIEKKLRHERR